AALNAFGPNSGGWSSDDRFPRHLADINGDGNADIVAFGDSSVYVALANGQGGFISPTVATYNFTPQSGGWYSNDTYPRFLADINGDSKADTVAFGPDGVVVSDANDWFI
ncbi:FG-GAP repeat domain-containing protein, partial [Devosia sp. LjRoot3]|uniref:FG-GAP repeat domain-containing protein n=1 Tax=Devosia sp. LjRoot3 TaxID=3342319 RepID=UPI003F502AC4